MRIYCILQKKMEGNGPLIVKIASSSYPTMGGSAGNGQPYLVSVHFDDKVCDFDLNLGNFDRCFQK